jgi:hypothetical protein
MRTTTVSFLARCLAMASLIPLTLAAGCGGEPRTVGGAKPKAPAAPVDESAKPRDTLGKTTQNVYDLKEELAKGGVVANFKVDVSTPLIGSAAAYAPMVGKIGTQKVEMDLNLYHAMNDRYPATYQEFMDEIIKVGKPDGVQLPMLPYYQEYAYDVDNHKLVVVEYPARKEARQRELNK